MDRQKLRRELRAVEGKLREWDPIGVLSDPTWPRDEYDSYAPQVLGLLQSGATVNVLADHLNNIATLSMGLRARPDNESAFAEGLLKWWKSFSRENDAA